MPLDVRPAKELIEAKRPFRHDVTPLTKSVEGSHESMDVAMLLQQAPVEPADIGVLAVGVIVAPLGPADFVAHEQHRRAGCQQIECEEVLDLAIAQRLHHWIIGGSLHAAIPAQIVIGAVAVVLAIGLVVLVVVRHQIIEGEAVMAGHEIDALLGLALLVSVDVRAAQDPTGDARHRAAVAFEEPPHVVTEPAVPLLPPLADKASHLIESCSIPRLRNQLGAGQ